ncbi:hypothetical protein BH708_02300 [Brachybacterium sp. P6-10-X1]|uniref:hypothetical protein n=1 Tax=Brachybacterium sp. P6-10-X1 TaxID=1903186 RepID=UPI000971804F|nr:hypothetical protein [Brachybacterium sp. P6-10-X1]APX31739.1 hypothetical protein BH708_02300 [Brachybacterium sp. P6-10-X1]
MRTHPDTSSKVRKTARHHRRCECDRDTLDTPWKAQVCQILHTRDQAAARALLDQFLLANEVEIARVIRRAQRVAHLDYRDKDTAYSYFGQALMKMIDQRWRAKTGPGTSQVFNYSRNLPSILEAETRYVVREDRRRGLLDGTAGVPGDSAHDRKAKALARSRQLFEREHARTPEDDELVTFHNERMRDTRKDPARQSVLATASDLRSLTAVPLQDPDLTTEPGLVSEDAPDLGLPERQQRLNAVIAECQQKDIERERTRRRALKREPVQMATVARVYLADHAHGELATRQEIIDKLGITQQAARREVGSHLQEIMTLLKNAFSDYHRA